VPHLFEVAIKSISARPKQFLIRKPNQQGSAIKEKLVENNSP
jgi:hypothetical protein